MKEGRKRGRKGKGTNESIAFKGWNQSDGVERPTDRTKSSSPRPTIKTVTIQQTDNTTTTTTTTVPQRREGGKKEGKKEGTTNEKNNERTTNERTTNEQTTNEQRTNEQRTNNDDDNDNVTANTADRPPDNEHQRTHSLTHCQRTQLTHSLSAHSAQSVS